MRISFKIEIGSFSLDYNVGGPGVLIRWPSPKKASGTKECWIGRDDTGRMQLVRG